VTGGEEEPGVSRRVVLASAWSVPVVAAVVSTPAAAASYFSMVILTVNPVSLLLTDTGSSWSGSATITLQSTMEGPLRGGLTILAWPTGPFRVSSVNTPGWVLRPDSSYDDITTTVTFQGGETRTVNITCSGSGSPGDTGSMFFEAVAVGMNTLDLPIALGTVRS
jgi:hypothetical protein